MGTKEASKRKSEQDLKSANKKSKNDASSEAQISSSAQKRQVRKERQSHRRHADTVSEAKDLWNQLREKTNSPMKTKEIMEKVMKLLRGKVSEISLQHDASRVFQAAVQFGSLEQRRELLKEVCDSEGGLAELSKIQYAHFCCLKLIKYCAKDEPSMKLIVKSFKGSIPKMAVHSIASRVLDALFLNFPPKHTAELKQEFYGPHFKLFAQNVKGVPTLKLCLESTTTDTQKDAALNFVKDILVKGMAKSFFGLTYFQELFAEYLEVADPDEIRSTASSVVDHSVHLLSTRAGAKVVAACASYGTPKDRKRILKSLKGYTNTSLLHRDAYLAILRIVQVTDDTVSIHKSILTEITAPAKDSEGDDDSSPLLPLALSEAGSKLFLMILVKDEQQRMKYFDPYEQSILKPQATITENGKEVPTSKKDPEMRREELLKYLKGDMEMLCVKHADVLLRSVPGSRVLKEVYSNLLPMEVVNAVVDVCEADLKSKGSKDESDEESLFEDRLGHRAVKNLIVCDADKDEPLFSRTLVKRLGSRLPEIAETNRGAFVVAALFKVKSLRKEVFGIMKPAKKKLKELTKSKDSSAGFGVILKELSI